MVFASTIAERFHDTCRERGDARAVLELPGGGAVSFRQLHQRYAFTLQALKRLGIGPGDCVATLLGNRTSFLTTLVACMEAGAALLPIGESTDAEAVTMIRNAGAAAVVTNRRLPVPFTDETLLGDDDVIGRVRAGGSTLDLPPSVLIKLTSGSTDLPKAAVATDRSLLDDTASITAAIGVEARDVSLGIIPLSHAYAISHVVVPLIAQGTGLALRSSFAPSQFVNDAAVSGATVFAGVPFMFDRLRDHLHEGALPSSLRLLVTAGARIDPATVRWFFEQAHRKIHSFYGTSEAGGITYDDTDELAEPLHVGRPIPNVHVRVLPESGVAAGGRIYVRGPGMALGYARVSGPDRDDAFFDGGFRTADLGYFDDAGRLVLTGRLSTLVNVAGRKVDPAEVERALLGIPGVSDARVLGVDARPRGQELVAFVVRSSSVQTPLTLRKCCAGLLSPYKIPRRFIFLDEWPVDARGKVDRRVLHSLASHT
jgi:long-chain acyl-CoA synthetase